MDKPNLQLSMIVLAGGESRRMGEDKASLLYEGRTFLQHQIEKGRALGIEDILVSGYRGKDCDYPVIPDRYVKKGPLGGIEACMREAKNRKCLVVTADVPRLPLSALEKLAGEALRSDAPAVILQHGNRYEPLMSVLDTSLRPLLEREAIEGSGALMRVLRETGYDICEVPDSPEFDNINDPESYARLCSGQEETEAPGKDTVCERQVRRLENGEWKETQLTLAREAVLRLTVNGGEEEKIVCSPTALREMLLGRLFCAGEKVIRLELDEETLTARAETVPAESGGNGTASSVEWEPEWIEKLARSLNSHTPIYKASRSAHSCQLLRGGEILCCMEDIGRHNAVDKVIGRALDTGVELSKCILFTSGRIPTDMVRKLIRAGIRVAAGKAMPTAEAAALAAAHGITLLHISPYLGLVRIC